MELEYTSFIWFQLLNLLTFVKIHACKKKKKKSEYSCSLIDTEIIENVIQSKKLGQLF